MLGYAAARIARGPGGCQTLVVSESGLYTLILRNRGAVIEGTVSHRFLRWVTGGVLPAIRETGSYAPAAAPATGVAGMLEALKDQTTVLALIAHHAQEALTARAEAKGQALVVAYTRIAEQRPAVEAFRRLADADGTWCISDAAKALGIRPSDLSKWLRDNGWVFARRGSKRILAHQNRLKDGCLVHKITLVPDEERAYTQVRVTAKGLARLALAFQACLPGL